MNKTQIENTNEMLRGMSPEQIVEWVYSQKENALITTNFRPYEGAILHLVVSRIPNLPVVWCDTGYNTRYTYKHAIELIEILKLNVDIFTPKLTSAYRDVLMGIPNVGDKNHSLFTEQVKLEPFNRAMDKYKPDLWFTNLRKGQTALRDSLDILSIGRNGEWKVSPFFYYSDDQLEDYINKHNIPNEKRYYDPTKALDNRECGLHT